MRRPGGAATVLADALARLAGPGLPVRLRTWDGSEAGPAGAPVAVLRNRRALRHLLWSPGELGLARAYVSGDLEVDGDLEDGLRRLRRFGRDEGTELQVGGRALVGAVGAAVRVGAVGPRPVPPAAEARVGGVLHSRARDAAAIAHHYDLSNEFYELLLDGSMAYSCAYWTSDAPEYGLADAQRDKLDLVCRKLGLGPGARLLDVGCGWGSLSLHAAEHHGARVTGVTLSREQLELAQKRVADRGLDGRVELRLQDYRDIDDGPFDAVASIEMGEHVGAENYPQFAAHLHRLVRPAGRVLVQQMSRGEKHPGGGPFIERYVAPDMHMRPVGETVALLEAAGLEVRDVHALREHYVRTIRAWHETLEARWDDAVRLVGEQVARVWRLYLVGGLLTFEDGAMGVDQILAVRRDPDGRSGMAPVRTW